MKIKTARLITGQFFRRVIIFFLFLAALSCEAEQNTAVTDYRLPETGATSILIHFQGVALDDSMPEATSDLLYTASGRLHLSRIQNYTSSAIAQEADSSGKLLMMILFENDSFSGIRDHLIIRIDSCGIPVAVEPDVNSNLFADSLWKDPVVRQQTILKLVDFFKPDIVFQTINEMESCYQITQFWSKHGMENNITVALYTSGRSAIANRNWGVFTGKGIRNGQLDGMDFPGFIATFKMISGMEWKDHGHGHPAMQAFFTTEAK